LGIDATTKRKGGKGAAARSGKNLEGRARMVMAIRGIIRWQTSADECPPAKRIRTNIWNGMHDFNISALCKSVGDGLPTTVKTESSGLSVAATECETEYTPVGACGHTVHCAHTPSRCIRSQTPPFDDFGFLPLGMMAKMIHSRDGVDVLETDSDTGSESSDEEEE